MTETGTVLSSARILVVNHETQLRAATARSLRGAGYAVVEAATGMEGLRLVRETRPDLVLVDVMLPDMNGLEVCHRIKTDTDLAGTFVVLLSGRRVDSDDQAEGLEKGSDGYIVRPNSNRELLARVEAMLRLHRAEELQRAQMRELRERNKELNCLYGTSKLIEQADLSLPEILQGTVELIPPAWQYPEIACARIVLDDRVFQTRGFRGTDWKQSCDIRVHGQVVGKIEVHYLEERPEEDEGSFLKEERTVLNAIAERLGRVVERMRTEEALRESKARLELAVTGSNGGMWHIALNPDDPSQTLPDEIFLAPRLKHLLGYEDEEFPNSLAAWESHVLPDDLPVLRESSQKCREGQIDRHELEYRVRHRDGSIRWLRSSGRVERGEDRQPLRFAGIDWDITARKHAEEALRYQPTLLKSVSDAVVTTGLDFSIQSWNSAAEALYGWRAEEAIGKSIAEVVPTEYPNDRYEAVLAQFLEEGVWQGEVIQKHKDGSDLYVLASVTLVRDDSGHPVSVLAINRDMTERKHVEIALKRERDLVAQVMDTSPVGIAVFDRLGRLTFANSLLHELAKVIGVATLIGRQYDDPAWQNITSDGEPLPSEALPFAQVMNTGQPVPNIEHSIKLPDGQRLHLSSSGAPLFDESGEIDSVVVTTADISQRKRVEAQLEEAAATAERERLARDLHDAVTQSLFSVASIAEALPRVWERDPEEGWRALDELRRLTQGALAEMRAMLLELRPAALTEQGLGALLRQLTDAMMGRTRMPITTTVVGDCEVPDDVQIALYRIAQEALNNVIKHARASQAKLSLHCQPGQVRLSIGDDGLGFDLESAQAHQLGLDIMRERAEAIGASLGIESQPGHGSRVEVNWRRPRERTE
jgi:PAS domain S-box-containing protein